MPSRINHSRKLSGLKQSRAANSHGFSLLEVLISLVILSIGLLGLAAIQAIAMQQTLNAHHRTKAVAYSYDILDRMRANRRAIDEYDILSGSDGDAWRNVTCVVPLNATGTIAEVDIAEWQNVLACNLSNGIGAIAVADGAVTITICWEERNSEQLDPVTLDAIPELCNPDPDPDADPPSPSLMGFFREVRL